MDLGILVPPVGVEGRTQGYMGRHIGVIGVNSSACDPQAFAVVHIKGNPSDLRQHWRIVSGHAEGLIDPGLDLDPRALPAAELLDLIEEQANFLSGCRLFRGHLLDELGRRRRLRAG
ncbi:MAG TPA: hypothetical protein VD969_05430 [Symbiobacteriaceae bacterium]|nr:hypothetical protein [Symbiobacteriaceae bacterium]